MNARRWTWIAFFVGLGIMVTMLVLQKLSPPPGSSSTPAAQATKPAAKPVATAGKPTSRQTASGPEAATTTTAASAPSLASAPATSAPIAWGNDTFSLKEAYLGSLVKGGDYRMQVQITGQGAAVKTIKLADYFATVDDLRRYEKDPATYDQAVADDTAGKLQGHFCIIRLVGLGDDLTYPLATRKIIFKEGGQLNLADLIGRGESARTRWSVGETKTDDAGQSVTLTSIIRRGGEPYVRLEKTYRLPKHSFGLDVSLKVVSLTAPVDYQLVQFGPIGVTREDARNDERRMYFGQLVKSDINVNRMEMKEADNTSPGFEHVKVLGGGDQPGVWEGVGDKFFLSAMYVLPQRPQFGGQLSPGLLLNPEAQFFWGSLRETPTEGPGGKTFLTGVNVGYGGTFLQSKPGQDSVTNLNLYAGPKDNKIFDVPVVVPGHDQPIPLYVALKYRDTLEAGSCCGMSWCSFSFLTQFMIKMLDFFYMGTHNYGVAIIILVILVRLALHPLTKKGQVSMSKMQKLQPQIAKLREQYKDDKAKLNEEMMKVYKQAGGSPFLGFLPMFLQMPIWIALWTALSGAVQLRHAAFLPFWITDLAAPDALFSFGQSYWIPGISGLGLGPVSSFNLLPILFGISMILQQKFMPTAAAPPTAGGPSDPQAKMQKQMMYFMNIFFMLIFYNAPSGLTLYMMTSNFVGLGEQYVIRKHIREREEAEARGETAAAAPSKLFRGHKPKKPKGPFKF